MIFAVPPDTPVNVPSVPIDATPPLLLVHTPPADASVSTIDEPWHIALLFDIADGIAFTVTTADMKQPLVIV